MLDLRGKTLLIVDDEPEMLDLLVSRFASGGARVLTASNGIDGFRIFETETVDLILSDIQMPGEDGDGFTFLRRVRDRNPSTPPFILMSGNLDRNKDPEKTRGVSHILGKPFSFGRLEALVGKLLVDPPVTRVALATLIA
jgi:two-component system OmpR family response regulator